MANEFIARKGLISLGDSQITGSLETTSNLNIEGSGSFYEANFKVGTYSPAGPMFELTTSPAQYSSQIILRPSANSAYNSNYWSSIRHSPSGTYRGLWLITGNYSGEIVFAKGTPYTTSPTMFGLLSQEGLKIGNSTNLGFAEEKLHVVGNAKITGFVTASGNLITEANITASGHVSASTYYGDGSNLTSLPTQDPFPYTGDAVISGSLEVSNPQTSSQFIKIEYNQSDDYRTRLTVDGPRVGTWDGGGEIMLKRSINTPGDGGTLLLSGFGSTGNNTPHIQSSTSELVFADALVPNANGSYNLGLSSRKWGTLWGSNLDIKSTSTSSPTVTISGSNSLAGNYALKVANTTTDILTVENDKEVRVYNDLQVGVRADDNGNAGTLTINGDAQAGHNPTFIMDGGWHGNADKLIVEIGDHSNYGPTFKANQYRFAESNGDKILDLGGGSDLGVTISGNLVNLSGGILGQGMHLRTAENLQTFQHTGFVYDWLEWTGGNSTGQGYTFHTYTHKNLLALDGTTGRVGIGTSSPTAMLHVTGAIYTETNITASGHVSASTYYGDGSNLTGIAGISFNGSTANGLVTYGSATTADVESKLTFGSSILQVNATNSDGLYVRIGGGAFQAQAPYIEAGGLSSILQLGSTSTGKVLDMRGNKLAFDSDSTNTYIQTDTDTPENLEIHVDGNLELRADDEVQIFSDVDVTGGITLTGDISGNGSTLKVSEIASSAGPAASSGDKGLNAETITFYSNTVVAGAVYYLGSSAWALSDADAESTSKGFMGVATSTNSNTGMVIRGIVYVGNDPGGSVGDIVYLSTTGGRLTNDVSAFTANDIVRVMGYKVGTNLVFFDPSKDWIEIS